EQRILATVPPFHIYGLLFSLLVPLMAGAQIVCSTPLHAETVASTVLRLQCTGLVSVPAHLRNLCILQPGALPAQLQIFSSGAELPEPTAEQLRKLFAISVCEIYGSSETGGIGWRQR